jgi:hypothetical protein
MKNHPFSVRSDGLIELHSEFALWNIGWMFGLEGKPITPRNESSHRDKFTLV